MTEVADRFVVVLDANVLYPFRVRDILLRFAESGLYRARWSDQIIAEWTDNLLAEKPDLRDSVMSQLEAMRRAFPEAYVEGYDALIETLQLPDENDRHVLAAAIRADAQHIVTENLKDFPCEILEPYGVEAITADEFLFRTYELYPSEGTTSLRKTRQAYRNPPMNASEFIIDLMRVGLVKTAGMAKGYIDLI